MAAIDTRAIGLAVIELGGGRRQVTDRIDPAVGFSRITAPGDPVDRTERPLAVVHAANEDAASAAAAAVISAISVATAPVLVEATKDHPKSRDPVISLLKT